MLSDARSRDRQVTSTPSTAPSPLTTPAATAVLATSVAAPSPVTATPSLGQGDVPASGPDARGPASVHDIEDRLAEIVRALVDGSGERAELVELAVRAVSTVPLGDPGAAGAVVATLLQIALDEANSYVETLDGRGLTPESYAPAAARYTLVLEFVRDVVVGIEPLLLAGLPALPLLLLSQQDVQRCLSAFLEGLASALEEQGVADAGFWYALFDRGANAWSTHAVIGGHVISIGMYVGILTTLASDLLALAGLLALLASGPVLVALIAYIAHEAFEAGAEGTARELGSLIGAAVAEPFHDLANVQGEVRFLFTLGMIVGPVAFDAICWATGAEPLVIAAKALEAGGVGGRLFKVVRVLLPDWHEVKAILALADRRLTRLLDMFDLVEEALSTETAKAGLKRIRNCPDVDGMLAELASWMTDDSLDVFETEADALIKVIDINQVERLLEAVASLNDLEFAGLRHFRRYERSLSSPIAPWTEIMSYTELDDQMRHFLFASLGELDGKVADSDTGLAIVIDELCYAKTVTSKVQGAIGVLQSASTALARNPDLRFAFEVGMDAPEGKRIVDLVIYALHTDLDLSADDGFYTVLLESEVKAYVKGWLSTEQTKRLATQLRKDLSRRIAAGDVTFDKLKIWLDPSQHATLKPEFERILREELRAIGNSSKQSLPIPFKDLEANLDVALARATEPVIDAYSGSIR